MFERQGPQFGPYELGFAENEEPPRSTKTKTKMTMQKVEKVVKQKSGGWKMTWRERTTWKM